MKTMLIILVVITLLTGIGYWGLHVPPKPFAPYPESTPALKLVPIPAGLPAPVQRFYQATTGAQVPVIDTAMITVHGSMKLFGMRVPMRSRVAHQAGQGFWRTTSAATGEQRFQGMRLDTAGVVAWNDEAPWFERITDEVVYNVEIMPFVQANQP